MDNTSDKITPSWPEAAGAIEKINPADGAFNHILAIIAAQGYEPGSKIPTGSKLVLSIGVSRNALLR